MSSLTQSFDVLVVGGGNAGLCAAIMARRAGARVLVLESATKDFRGGNSRHTRDIRYMRGNVEFGWNDSEAGKFANGRAHDAGKSVSAAREQAGVAREL